MSLTIERINNSKVLIATDKGTYNIDLSKIKSIQGVTVDGYLNPRHFFSVIEKDDSRNSVLFGSECDAVDTYEYVCQQLRDYLIHCDALENSSEPAKTRIVDASELILNWGAHTVKIDLRSFNKLSLGNLSLTVSGSDWSFFFTSSKREYLEQLRTSLENYLKRNKN